MVAAKVDLELPVLLPIGHENSSATWMCSGLMYVHGADLERTSSKLGSQRKQSRKNSPLQKMVARTLRQAVLHLLLTAKRTVREPGRAE